MEILVEVSYLDYFACRRADWKNRREERFGMSCTYVMILKKRFKIQLYSKDIHVKNVVVCKKICNKKGLHRKMSHTLLGTIMFIFPVNAKRVNYYY